MLIPPLYCDLHDKINRDPILNSPSVELNSTRHNEIGCTRILGTHTIPNIWLKYYTWQILQNRVFSYNWYRHDMNYNWAIWHYSSFKFHKQYSERQQKLYEINALSLVPEMPKKCVRSLTLSQWSSSGNPVAIQCAWNLDPSAHWNATGEMSVCFQWSSSGFPVVLQCVPIMQINTGSPLGHHWVQASASVVPVASQCTCGSSGLPVCSNYAN